MERKSIQLSAIAAAAVLLGATAVVSFAGYGNGTNELASNSEPGDIMADLFALQYADAAQVDYFLKVDGIDGEATHPNHSGEIEVLSWSWGASNSGSFSGGGGGGAGKATFSDISIVKTLDKSSPKLFLATASGEHIKEVKLSGSTIVSADKKTTKSEDYYTITLSEVFVTSYQPSGSSGDMRPTESVSLNFAKIEIQYKPQKPDGTLGEPIIAKWDIAGNAEA